MHPGMSDNGRLLSFLKKEDERFMQAVERIYGSRVVVGPAPFPAPVAHQEGEVAEPVPHLLPTTADRLLGSPRQGDGRQSRRRGQTLLGP